MAEVEAAAGPASALPLGIAGAEPVVLGPFLRIAENFIGLVDLLELLFGLVIAGIFVRVITLRQFAEGAFDFFFGGVFAHTQGFVIVFVFHNGQPAPFYSRPEREESSSVWGRILYNANTPRFCFRFPFFPARDI